MIVWKGMVLNDSWIPTVAFLMPTVKRIIPVFFFEEQTEINFPYYGKGHLLLIWFHLAMNTLDQT